jgi:hypothetical protein
MVGATSEAGGIEMRRMKLTWAAIPIAAVGMMLFAGTASASTVTIVDESNVLNATTVQNEAATLPVPIYIWTTTQDAANKSAFDNDVRLKVSSQFPIVLGINTQAKHETIQINSASGFRTQQSAIAAEDAANTEFDNSMRSQNDYTAAVGAAVSSLRSSLESQGSSGTSTATGRSRGGFSVFWGIVILIIFVVIVALLGRLFRGNRRPRPMMGQPMNYGPGPGPGYGPGFGPGPGYGGGGMSPGAAGVAGAVGGGLLGYELGKMEGERQEFRRDEMRGGFGNQGYDQGYNQGGFGGDQGGGGWTVGQDSDFGNGGGGGDWGGGGDNSGGGGGGGDW